MLCVKACSQEEACGTGLKDQQVLGVQGYAQLFQHSVETLRSQLREKGEGAELVWDKVSFHKLAWIVQKLLLCERVQTSVQPIHQQNELKILLAVNFYIFHQNKRNAVLIYNY